MAAILFPVLTLFITPGEGGHYLVNSGSYVIFGIVMAAIVIFNHRSNLSRILKGEEHKLSFSKTTE